MFTFRHDELPREVYCCGTMLRYDYSKSKFFTANTSAEIDYNVIRDFEDLFDTFTSFPDPIRLRQELVNVYLDVIQPHIESGDAYRSHSGHWVLRERAMRRRPGSNVALRYTTCNIHEIFKDDYCLAELIIATVALIRLKVYFIKNDDA